MTNAQLYFAEQVTNYIRNNRYWMTDRDIRTLGHLRRDIVCKDSPIGEYKCYSEIQFSPQNEVKPICIDTCLQHEIWELLNIKGVKTIGCCCGHGAKKAYIQVTLEYVQKMHELGYKEFSEKEDGQGRWCFKPKTYFPEPLEGQYTKELIL